MQDILLEVKQNDTVPIMQEIIFYLGRSDTGQQKI